MPYRRRRRFRKRRPFRKYRKRYAKKTRKTTFMLGRSHKTRLRYESIINLTPSIDPGHNHIFSANDLFDPDVTGTGHQPRGFDQLMGMFDHFTVIGSKITVKFMNSDSIVQGVYCSVRLRDSVTVTGNLTTIREDPGVRSTILGASSSGRNMGTLTKGFSAKKFFGKPPMGIDQAQGSATASPLEGAYYHINTASQASGSTNAIEAYVTIDYTAIFTEPKMPATS